jgi:hypothetical protein
MIGRRCGNPYPLSYSRLKGPVICYSRENPAGEPHPTMQVVLDAMVSSRFPIGLFTDATFKTAVKVQ